MPERHATPFWTLSEHDQDRPALILADGSPLSYRALAQMADRYARSLQALAGDRQPLVTLDFVTSPEAIAAYLGALRSGYPLLVLERGQADAGTRIHDVWQPDIHLRADAAGGVTPVPRPGWQDEPRKIPHPDLRLLLSTSGSTGEPKLVRLSGGNIASNAQAIAEYLQLSADDRAATVLPLFYSYGLSVLNSYLAAGAALVLTDLSVTEPAFFEQARRHRVTSLALVPHQFDLLARSGFDGTALPDLRYITQAGGRLTPDKVRHFNDLGRKAGWDLVLMYGQTEAAPRISYVPPSALPGAADTIGLPIPGGRIWLADEEGREITRAGVEGELVYEGPNVMLGYASTRDDLAAPAGPAELRSGDIAERTAEGYFRIVGRMKRFVKLFGLRLSLDQIELLLRDQKISAHAVSAGDRLVLLLPDAGTEAGASPQAASGQILAARKAVAERYDLPLDEIYAGPLNEMPLLPSGKIDQKGLERIAGAIADEAQSALRRKVAETSLADILREATRSPSIAPGDSFTSLGGDSLSYIRVQMVLEERLGAAPEGWENMSLAQLEARSPVTGAVRARPTSLIGGDILLRLAAIALIVAQHASNYSLFGGTWILIAVMGFSMARFQLRQIESGRASQFFFRMLYPIVPLYFLLLVVYATLRDKPPLSYFFLLGNYEPWSGGSLLVVYWFVSLYAQIVLVMALVTAIPALRKPAVTTPWAFGAAASALLIAVMIGLLVLAGGREGLPYHPQRGLAECLSVFFLGWMLRTMQGPRQIAVTLVMAVATLALLRLLDMTPQVLVVASVGLALLALRFSVPVPRGLGRFLSALAGVTLYVYLAHEILVFGIAKLGLSDPLNVLLSLVLSFAFALGAKWVFDRIDTVLFSYRNRETRDIRQAANNNL